MDGCRVAVRRIVINIGRPLRRTRGNHERSRRNHVRLEAAVHAFRADADISATGETGNLKTGIGGRLPRKTLIALRVRDDVRDVAQLLDGSDGDDVFSGGRRKNRVLKSAAAAVVSASIVASRKNKQHRLRTRRAW